ncbi:DNA polymerase processivity factor [Stenotrophomonas phage vB_SmaS-DLP_2]|uniref:Replicative clamp n=1 Tax=Stenotrophomonas phage vB_SmaS-DLP_2 TaxID=1642663 RepID=A0A0M3MYU9_9CAUD|nr:DNA polymerase processivity factor [Stenotrophomonas phage vB_SmaS-DLP_2]AKI28738.1 replicative clamp [Stenotrophomonas phage vB_SmaS-DLP_2]
MKIDSNIPLPPEDEAPAAEQPKKKPRARRQAAAGKKKAKGPSPAASLLAALKFVAIAQKKAGPTNVQFGHIAHNWAAASDGVLTVAHPIEEDLVACPHTLQFIDALSKVGEELSITQLTANALAVSSGAFRALVPCVGFDDVPITAPDPQCATIDDRIKTAFAAVAGLATDGAPNATFAAVLLQAGSAVATNGAALLEAWHGIDLPPGMMLPKCAAVAVAKAGPALTGFGFSASSATFYFENGAFIKTQLYGERYPNYQIVFEVEGLNPWPVPDDFYNGVRAIQSFSPNGNVFFDDGAVLSKMHKEEASTYKIEGLPERMGFSAKLLLSVEHAFKKAHFAPDANKVVFFGENIRGALMGLDLGSEATHNTSNNYEDDIPF